VFLSQTYQTTSYASSCSSSSLLLSSCMSPPLSSLFQRCLCCGNCHFLDLSPWFSISFSVTFWVPLHTTTLFFVSPLFSSPLPDTSYFTGRSLPDGGPAPSIKSSPETAYPLFGARLIYHDLPALSRVTQFASWRLPPIFERTVCSLSSQQSLTGLFPYGWPGESADEDRCSLLMAAPSPFT